MSRTTTSRRAIGVLAIAALTSTGLAGATAARTVEEPEPEGIVRVAGDNRYETAALVSERFPDGVDTVYIANGENWAQGADALVAGAAAGSGTVPELPGLPTPSGNPAPILLVKGLGVPKDTRDAIAELQPDTAVILGGPLVIAPTVDEELAAMGLETVRVLGEDRYGTAAVLSTAFEPGVETVYVASGEPVIPKPPFWPMLADALSASARAGGQGVPVLLTKMDSLPRLTREALVALEPESITVVGGFYSISPQVRIELEQIAPVTVVEGENRYETAARLTEPYAAGSETVYVASGAWFPDALAVSALAGAEGAPLILSPGAIVPQAVRPHVERLAPQSATLVGGRDVLDDGLAEELAEILADLPD